MAKNTKPTGLRALLDAQKPVEKTVQIMPGNPELAHIRELDLDGYLQIGEHLQAAGKDQRALRRVNAWLVAVCTYDKSGQRIYNPDSDADLDAIIRLPNGVRSRLIAAANEVNGFTTSRVEDAEKN